MQSWEEKMYYEEKGRKEGHASGLKEGHATGLKEGHDSGVIDGKTSSVLELLQELGTIPEELRGRIMEQKDEATISKWLRLAAKCDSIEEFAENM